MSFETLPVDERDAAGALANAFAAQYGHAPAAVAVAPGRVNLIGEHTDYNGLPVLPMAIDRTVRVAVVPRLDRVVLLHNLDGSFPSRRYQIGADIPPFAAGDWGNYHKAAAQGLVRHLGGVSWRGGEFLTGGDIPAGAGLSSSSALVVASALALLAANEASLPAVELAELLPRAERYVGTLSGGMDQAVSLLARPQHALRIDFFPLRARPVRLPADMAVVVCHSLVRAEKSAGARAAYNQRVLECRLACAALERVLGDRLPGPLGTLGDLSRHFPGQPLLEFAEALAERLPDRPLSLAEIAAYLGTDPADLCREGEVADTERRFTLVRRTRHVLTEADRVNAAEPLLESGDLAAFGALMLASHESCRRDYEVSCPALDELVSAAMASGALGARLTGAGFGGCTVNLLHRQAIGDFLEQIDRRFYAPRLATGESADRHRFGLTARGGAQLVRP